MPWGGDLAVAGRQNDVCWCCTSFQVWPQHLQVDVQKHGMARTIRAISCRALSDDQVAAAGCATTPSLMLGAYLTDVKWAACMCGFLPEGATQMRQRKLLAKMYFPCNACEAPTAS